MSTLFVSLAHSMHAMTCLNCKSSTHDRIPVQMGQMGQGGVICLQIYPFFKQWFGKPASVLYFLPSSLPQQITSPPVVKLSLWESYFTAESNCLSNENAPVMRYCLFVGSISTATLSELKLLSIINFHSALEVRWMKAVTQRKSTCLLC